MGLELAIAGGILAIISGVNAQEQQEANAEAQEELLNYNAKQERREADYELANTQAAEERQRAEQARLRSAQQALYGKSGAALATGSPLAVLGETAANQELANQDLRLQGATAYNRRMSMANGLSYQAKVAGNSVGNSALLGGIAGGMSSFGSALSQGSDLGKGLYKVHNTYVG